MMRTLSRKENIHILGNNYIGRLGYIFQGNPYVVPITYYYDQATNGIIGYSADGQKISALRMNPTVSLAVDEIEAADHWQSVLVHGTFEEIDGSEAKYLLQHFALGVKMIIAQKEQKVPRFISEFSSKIETRGIPLVYRLKILEITGKKREGDSECLAP